MDSIKQFKDWRNKKKIINVASSQVQTKEEFPNLLPYNDNPQIKDIEKSSEEQLPNTQTKVPPKSESVFYIPSYSPGVRRPRRGNKITLGLEDMT